MALLSVLERLRGLLRLDLTVAHLNHGLRGDSADGDEAFVRAWCRDHQIAFVVRQTDVRQWAADHAMSLEEAGRSARLSFFDDLADLADAGRTCGPPAVIALAHHQDDQAETLLLHLGRGCGLDGLTGMSYKSGRLVRPLLDQSRKAIEAWLESQQISWRQDETNDDDFALRNRLRRQVLPVWSKALGYSPAPLLSRTAQILAEDRQYIDSLAAHAADACRRNDGWLLCEVERLPPALQSRVLRLAWREKTGSGKDLSYLHTRIISDWLRQARESQQISLPGGWRIRLDQGLLKFERPDPGLLAGPVPRAAAAADMQTELKLPTVPGQPAVTSFPHSDRQIVADLIENADQIVYNDTTECFHLDRIRGSVIRYRLPGDCIRPQGRSGSKTLKKFLNEQKVPPDRRGELLLVALDRSVVWLPGLAAGAEFIARPPADQPGRLVRLTIGCLTDASLKSLDA